MGRGRFRRQRPLCNRNGRPGRSGIITVAIDTGGDESKEARGIASAARDRLGKALRGDEEPASRTDLTVRMDALTLDVEGFGHAKFPVTPAKARKLITLGKPARFGRGEETLTDPEVRDTWDIPVGLVNAAWAPGVLKDVLATVKEELGLPKAAELDADLHSLLVYEPDQFFLKHQDTERTDEMIGTLVVTLPSAYAGGELMIGKGEDWKAYRGSRDALSLVAFYADCQHEVLKLKSGYRITLTYNLMLRGNTSPRAEGDAGTVAELTGLLREHFGTPATHSWGHHQADPPSRLVYLLDHEYTPRALKWSRLKGADARRGPCCARRPRQPDTKRSSGSPTSGPRTTPGPPTRGTATGAAGTTTTTRTHQTPASTRSTTWSIRRSRSPTGPARTATGWRKPRCR